MFTGPAFRNDNDDPFSSSSSKTPRFIDDNSDDYKNTFNEIYLARQKTQEVKNSLFKTKLCVSKASQFMNPYGFPYQHSPMPSMEPYSIHLIQNLHGKRTPRLYLPREYLTEQYNNQKTNEEVTESFLYLDYYIARKTKANVKKLPTEFNEFEIAMGVECVKAPPPVIGETLFLQRRNIHPRDHKTIKAFTGRVIEVYQGTVNMHLSAAKEGEIKYNPRESNFGLILVNVEETTGGYNRSLVLPPFMAAKNPPERGSV